MRSIQKCSSLVKGSLVAIGFILLATSPTRIVHAVDPVVLTVDTNVDSLINSGCTESVDDDDCSLRGAITLANADSSNGYHIDIPIGVYLLNLNSSNATEDANISGDLDILNPSVTLHGESLLLTILDGNATDRVIDQHGDELTINMLTIRNGSLETGEGGGAGIRVATGNLLETNYVRIISNSVTCAGHQYDNGGGIHGWQDASLYLTYTGIHENTACNGGGIYASHNMLMIQDSNIEDNTANQSDSIGGGIANANVGTLAIERSTIDGNTADRGGGLFNSGRFTTSNSIYAYNEAIDGAGMYLYGTSSLTDVTIHNNTADDDGGGIALDGQADLYNVTLAGNSAMTGGGIQLMAGEESILNLDHTSFAANDITSFGYAIHASSDTTVTVTNSILASPSTYSTCYIDITATWTSNGFNISNDTSCRLYGSGDWVNTNPQLGFLGDYGGFTLTLPLLPNSPAINLGDPDDPTDRLDQRGVPIVGGRSDIGAFEYYPPLIWLPLTIK